MSNDCYICIRCCNIPVLPESVRNGQSNPERIVRPHLDTIVAKIPILQDNYVSMSSGNIINNIPPQQIVQSSYTGYMHVCNVLHKPTHAGLHSCKVG